MWMKHGPANVATDTLRVWLTFCSFGFVTHGLESDDTVWTAEVRAHQG